MKKLEFFNGNDTRVYTSQFAQKLKDEVSKMSDSNISTCDIQEWVDYLVGKYEIIPITLFEESITQSLSETKVKRYNPFSKHSPYEKEYFDIDGYRITFTIPFDGDENLFYLQPSSRILTRFNVADFNAPHRDDCGNFALSFEYTKQELQEKGQEMQKYVKTQFENEFRSYRTMIGNVNSEINAFNNHLPEFAKKCLEERKEKAASFALISQMLEIPLNKNDNAPNSVPVVIKRIARTPVQKPNQKPMPSEYSISDADYENINNIIMMSGTTMEKTARTYYRNNEEELRDHLLATLNTHYDNATGETFRKIGKTDIHIEFENKAAFIGECKIWHGEKLFAEAVQQLMNYSTWKDIKVSVVVFNKENQSFQGIVSKIDSWVKENTKSFSKKKTNMWTCEYYRSDMNVLVKLNILAFDLYVDKTQFRDERI